MCYVESVEHKANRSVYIQRQQMSLGWSERSKEGAARRGDRIKEEEREETWLIKETKRETESVRIRELLEN